MPLKTILEYPNESLRTRCQLVKEITPELLKLIQDMAETMYAAPGVGLAASQVGVPLRVAVVDVNWRQDEIKSPITIINPALVHAEGEILSDEGCLSVPGFTAEIPRHARVVVKGLDQEGREIELKAQGLMAIALQHELDHLNGVLFFDHLSPEKKEIIKKKLKARRKQETPGGQAP